MRRYRADPAAMRQCVAAEGMTLLYHRPSGTTHVLLPPAPEILELLSEEPADAATLLARISSLYLAVGETDEPIEEIVMARLAELEAVGLVRRA